MACFMGLVSFLAGRLEVLRVAPRNKLSLHNASARANIQSATTTDTPLTDAGLDGTGQVIQVRWALCSPAHAHSPISSASVAGQHFFSTVLFDAGQARLAKAFIART